MRLNRIKAATGMLISTSAIVIAGAVSLPAQAAPAMPTHPYCDPGTSYQLNKSQGFTWYAFDSGTIVNKSKKATIHRTISHSSTKSKSTTKSGEVGLSIKVWVADINAKYGYSVSKTVSYTRTDTFTVDVPPESKVKYKDGIVVRKFRIKIVHLYDNCTTKTSYGHVYAADNRSVVWDA